MDKDEALKLALEALQDADTYVHGADLAPAIAAIKAALAQPAQDPMNDVRGFLAERLTCWHRLTEKESDELVALFEVKPPQRTWVGLTNDEVNNFAAGCHLGNSVQGAIYKAEAKLKDKNI